MGFFDKLKSVAKYMSGGGAKVTMEVLDPAMDRPFKVRIHAAVADAEFKIDHVYLYLRAEEKITFPKDRIPKKEGEATSPTTSDLTEDVQTFKHEIRVTGPETLAANGQYDWETEVSLPAGLNPSYYGRNATHKYFALAGLDAPGNDPDSGWIEFRV